MNHDRPAGNPSEAIGGIPADQHLLQESLRRVAQEPARFAERIAARLVETDHAVAARFEHINLCDHVHEAIRCAKTLIRLPARSSEYERLMAALRSQCGASGIDAADLEILASLVVPVLSEFFDGTETDEEAELTRCWGPLLSDLLAKPAPSESKGETAPATGSSDAALQCVEELESLLDNHTATLHEEPCVHPRPDGASPRTIPKGDDMITASQQDGGTATLTEQEHATASRIQSMLDQMPINVIFADTDLTIQYLNPASVEKLRALEHYLPVKADEILGQNIDVFHADPSYQRRILGDPSNLPHRATITIGEEQLELLVSPVRDDAGQYLGPMVTWEVVTEKLKAENEMARVQNMMDNIPINVMMANRDFELVYMNPASRQTLQRLQHLLPAPLDQLVGQKIDIFHKNPEHQRQLLGNPNNLPHHSKIQLGEEHLDLLVSPIYDKDGDYVGPMVTWKLITQEVKLAENLRGVVKVVASSADQMESSSKNMAAVAEETSRQAQAVSAASEEATRNVETVSAAAEELTASINEIARHVQEANSKTSLAVEEAEQTNTTVRELGDASDEIGQVIKVITSIAQQTNLLALNATIEAARAGEAGKGFAVVANEVKELARQTAKATEEISQKIGSIQSSTGVAVTAIGAIGKHIREINEITTTITAAVEEQTAATNEISRNASEASRATAEVSSNISSVSQAADDGGKSAEEILKAAEQLANQAADLGRVTDEFMNRQE